ncbi:MAG: DUF58 domain-containing protein [Planctomycetota bacterium]|nr:DUF58 domain-containing protein [Planctomycetota bacterium]
MASPSRGKRIAVPTRRLGALCVFLALLAVGVLIHPVLALAWKAFVPFLGILLVIDFRIRPRSGSIEVLRVLGPVYHVGRKGKYRIRLSNRSGMHLEVGLREALPPPFEPQQIMKRLSLRAGASEEIEVEMLCLERGSFRIQPSTLEVSLPLGLLAYRETAGEGDVVKVLPGRPSGETEALLARAHLLDRVGDRPIRFLGQDREFESIREYVQGDDLRFVDWKATARRHRPQVRQYRMERNAEILLAIDSGRLMGSMIHGVRKLDLAMTPLLDLAAVALKREDRVGLLAFDSRVRAHLPPRGGLFQLGRILDTLAGLEAGFEETSFERAMMYLGRRQRKRSLVVLFTDFTDEISAREIHATLGALSRRHAVIFVVLSDPHLRDIFHREPLVERAVYQQAVAAELLTERRRVRAQAERLGAFTVEAEPSKLSAPLISKYVEVRSRVAL